MESMRELNRRVFSGEPLPRVFFQPRMEPWYEWHRRFGKLPEQFRAMSLPEFFDYLGVSMRYTHYYTGRPSPIERRLGPEVKVRHEDGADERRVIHLTPLGELVELQRRTLDGAWRRVEFPVKGTEDLKKLAAFCRHATYHFSLAKFQEGSDFIGERGEPQFFLPHSPYQALLYDYMRHEDFFCALFEAPEEITEAMRAIDESFDPLYEEVAKCGRVKIVNFGENLHGQLSPPAQFEEHLLPFYEKRSNQLRRAGIFTHVHIDGGAKPLLKYLKDLPFDGLEALTPKPQGDVTLEELKEHCGSKVLLDVLPAVMFLEDFTREQLMRQVEETVRLFHPRLVLGVSDEVPEGGGLEAAERVRLIAQWILRREAGPLERK
jgi:hypothetical protein